MASIRKLTILLIFACLGLVLGFLACKPTRQCQDPLGCLHFNNKNPIQIGVELATVGERLYPSMDLLEVLKEKILSQGENIADFPIKLTTYETTCNPSTRLAEAARIASNSSIAAFIGPACENESGSFEKLISDAGILEITLFPSKNKSFLPGSYSYNPPLEAQAIELVNLIKPLLTTDGLLIIYEDLPELPNFIGLICREVKDLRPCTSKIWEDKLDFIGNQSNSKQIKLMITNQEDFIQDQDSAVFSDFKNLLFFDPSLSYTPNSSPSPSKIRYIIPPLPLNPGPSGKMYYSSLAAHKSLSVLFDVISRVSYLDTSGSLILPRQAMRAEISTPGKVKGLLPIQPCIPSQECTLMDGFFRLVSDSPE